MKKALCAGVIALGIGFLAGPSVAMATETTAPTVADTCWLQFLTGPSRTVHQASPATVTSYKGPDCSEVVGLCITVLYPEGGGSRTVHSRRPADVPPCTPAGEACDITVKYVDLVDPPGPARSIHQVSTAHRPSIVPGVVYDIPPACEEAMVLALTPSGSNTGPTIWIATAFLGAGAVLIIAPRRLARR